MKRRLAAHLKARSPRADAVVALGALCRDVPLGEFAAAFARENSSTIVYPQEEVAFRNRLSGKLSENRKSYLAKRSYVADALALYSIADAQLFGSGFFILDPRQRLIRESTSHWSRGLPPDWETLMFEHIRKRASKQAAQRIGRRGRFGVPTIERPAEFLTGSHALASSHYESNFFHWHTDLLPIIPLLEKALPSQPVGILVGAENGFISKSLRYLGVPAERIVVLPPDKPVSVERLIFSSTHSTQGHRLHPRIRGLYDTIKGRAIPDRPAAAKRRVFVSRGESVRRLLINRAEVEERFERLGFEVIDPGRLSYEDQIRLFDEAEIVVGEHGGGLGNLGFCRPGTRVVELFHPRHNNLCYLSLSGISGLAHHIFVGSHDAATATPLCEWRVDVDAAAQFVERASDDVRVAG